jgi:hypothetical protein
LPDPVAIFEVGVLLLKFVLDPCIAERCGHFRQVDGGFERLALAEEQLPLAIRVAPVVQEPFCRPGASDITANAPGPDALADPIDPGTGHEPVLSPLGFELELTALFSRARDRQEVAALAPAVGDLIRDAFLIEDKVTLRFTER